MPDYLHTKFGLIWIKETKVTEGGGAESAPFQVENVLNRPGEMGLTNSFSGYMQSRLQITLHTVTFHTFLNTIFIDKHTLIGLLATIRTHSSWGFFIRAELAWVTGWPA